MGEVHRVKRPKFGKSVAIPSPEKATGSTERQKVVETILEAREAYTLSGQDWKELRDEGKR